MGDCPRCGSDRIKDIYNPNRTVVTWPETNVREDADKHEARCLNCGWYSVFTYRKGKGWEITDIVGKKKR